ncbi:MAG: hypothetical protein M0R37_14705 [Bacteroidales bacterium]|jgi:hypothetical protein|nr:hypothetical protein [Bacteroidales bacterium]
MNTENSTRTQYALNMERAAFLASSDSYRAMQAAKVAAAVALGQLRHHQAALAEIDGSPVWADPAVSCRCRLLVSLWLSKYGRAFDLAEVLEQQARGEHTSATVRAAA